MKRSPPPSPPSPSSLSSSSTLSTEQDFIINFNFYNKKQRKDELIKEKYNLLCVDNIREILYYLIDMRKGVEHVTRDISSWMLVSRDWYYVVREMLKLSVDLWDVDATRKLFKTNNSLFGYVRKACIRFWNEIPDDFLIKLPNIQQLTLEHDKNLISAPILVKSGTTDCSFPRIVSLSIEQCHTRYTKPPALKRFTALTELFISNCTIPVSYLKDLRDLFSVQRIVFKRITLLDNEFNETPFCEGLLQTSRMISLESLTVEDSSVHCGFVKELTRSETFHTLCLPNIHLNMDTLICISEISNITRLDLTNNLLRQKNFQTIFTLKNLTDLNIQKNDLDEIFMNRVLDLKKLTHLNVKDNNIRTVDIICQVENLTYLDISNNYLSNMEAKKLFAKNNIKTLILDGNPMNKYIFYGSLTDEDVDDMDHCLTLQDNIACGLKVENSQITEILISNNLHTVSMKDIEFKEYTELLALIKKKYFKNLEYSPYKKYYWGSGGLYLEE